MCLGPRAFIKLGADVGTAFVAGLIVRVTLGVERRAPFSQWPVASSMRRRAAARRYSGLFRGPCRGEMRVLGKNKALVSEPLPGRGKVAGNVLGRAAAMATKMAPEKVGLGPEGHLARSVTMPCFGAILESIKIEKKAKPISARELKITPS